MAVKKAPADGIYEAGNGRFRIREGDPFPDGEYKYFPNSTPTAPAQDDVDTDDTDVAVENETAAQKKARLAAEKKAADDAKRSGDGGANNDPADPSTPEGNAAPIVGPDGGPIVTPDDNAGPTDNRS